MKRSFEALLSAQRIGGGRIETGAPNFADVYGVHLYADLRLELALSAPESPLDASLYLRILQAFASSAEACSRTLNMRILEVQGERLHLFRQLPAPTQNTETELITFARVFHALAISNIEKEAPGYRTTLRFAVDHGRSLIIRTAQLDFSDSIISLGDPANRAAKRLAVPVKSGGVAAGHLSISRELRATGFSESLSWKDIDVSQPPQLKDLIDERLRTARAQFSVVEAQNRSITEASIAPNPGNPVSAPRFQTGFMFRADLDGFSRIVRAAFQGGDRALANLVENFAKLLKYPELFAETLPPGLEVTVFPWAGDCANLFVRCKDYPDARTYLPNKLGLNWHDLEKSKAVHSKALREAMGEAEWVVALAGGDPSESGHGKILTANVAAAGRLFCVGAGWSWRRSLDAEQSTGIKPSDTVIQVEDFQGLSLPYSDAYKEHETNPSLFRCASLKALRNVEEELSGALARQSRSEKYHSITVPQQRPYAESP